MTAASTASGTAGSRSRTGVITPADCFAGELRERVELVRRTPGQQLVEHGAERVDVRRRGHLLAGRLLGREIRRCAENRCRAASAASSRPRGRCRSRRPSAHRPRAGAGSPGFTSRWTSPASCACCNPAHACSASCDRLRSSAASRTRRAVSPGTYSMTMKGRPSSVSPASYTWTTFGCESRPASRASRRNRVRNVLVVAEMLGQHLHRDRPVQLLVVGEIHDRHAAVPERALDAIAAVGEASRSLVALAALLLALPFALTVLVALVGSSAGGTHWIREHEVVHAAPQLLLERSSARGRSLIAADRVLLQALPPA